MKIVFYAFFTFIFTCSSVYSQSTLKTVDTLSIEQQFDDLIKKSSPYEDFRVIKTDAIYKLKSNITDSIIASRKKLKDINLIVFSQKSTIDSLNADLIRSEENIQTLKNETQFISIIGIELDKKVFIIILISIIIILLGLVLYFISKFKQSNSITSNAQITLTELEEEFNTFRKNAMEREQKVKRELLDEINKKKKKS